MARMIFDVYVFFSSLAQIAVWMDPSAKCVAKRYMWAVAVHVFFFNLLSLFYQVRNVKSTLLYLLTISYPDSFVLSRSGLILVSDVLKAYVVF